MKNSFVLHHDSLAVLDALTDEQAGQLFKAMREYHASGVLPVDVLLRCALVPFINQWTRDLEKWERIAEIRRAYVHKGGLAKASKAKQPIAKASKSKQDLAKPSKASGNVSVSVSGSVSGSGSVSVKEKSAPSPFPTLEEVQAFFKENGYSIESATKAFKYYDDANWRDSRGELVRSWRQKMRGVWFRDEHRTTARAQWGTNQPAPAVYTPPENYRPV